VISGWSERRRARKEERLKKKFVRQVGPLIAEGEMMKAAMMARVAMEDVAAGRIWPEEELRQSYEEQSDDELEGFIGYEKAGMAMYAQEKGIPEERWAGDPVIAEMSRRMSIAQRILDSRRARG
jgi:hypothetical protein